MDKYCLVALEEEFLCNSEDEKDKKQEKNNKNHKKNFNSATKSDLNMIDEGESKSLGSNNRSYYYENSHKFINGEKINQTNETSINNKNENTGTNTSENINDKTNRDTDHNNTPYTNNCPSNTIDQDDKTRTSEGIDGVSYSDYMLSINQSIDKKAPDKTIIIKKNTSISDDTIDNSGTIENNITINKNNENSIISNNDTTNKKKGTEFSCDGKKNNDDYKWDKVENKKNRYEEENKTLKNNAGLLLHFKNMFLIDSLH